MAPFRANCHPLTSCKRFTCFIGQDLWWLVVSCDQEVNLFWEKRYWVSMGNLIDYQHCTNVFDGQNISLVLPPASQEIFPGVKWGNVGDFFTPAFWKHQAILQMAQGRYTRHKLTNSLPEELALCLLGGFGMPAEIGLAAFTTLRDRDLLSAGTGEEEIAACLKEPLLINGRPKRYRFWKQKAKYLAGSLERLAGDEIPDDDIELRDLLVTYPGIGPKTASWIVRNYRDSDDVAILDIHIIRACQEMGLFPAAVKLEREYTALEQRFLDFCRAVKIPAASMDALIWDYMRTLGPTVQDPPSSGSRKAHHKHTERDNSLLVA